MGLEGNNSLIVSVGKGMCYFRKEIWQLYVLIARGTCGPESFSGNAWEEETGETEYIWLKDMNVMT